jgi:hypothetical protein
LASADIGLGKVDLEAVALDLVAGPAMGAVSRALACAIGWRPAPDASMLWISTGVPVVCAVMVMDSPLGVMIFYASLASREQMMMMMKKQLTNSPLSRDTLKFSLLCVESANLFQKLGGNLARNALEGNSFPPPPETETVPVSGRDMVVDYW